MSLNLEMYYILLLDKILAFIPISSYFPPSPIPTPHKHKGPVTLKVCMCLLKDTDRYYFSKRRMSHGSHTFTTSPPFGQGTEVAARIPQEAGSWKRTLGPGFQVTRGPWRWGLLLDYYSKW